MNLLRLKFLNKLHLIQIHEFKKELKLISKLKNANIVNFIDLLLKNTIWNCFRIL
jgi:hypothetical protein